MAKGTGCGLQKSGFALDLNFTSSSKSPAVVAALFAVQSRHYALSVVAPSAFFAVPSAVALY